MTYTDKELDEIKRKAEDFMRGRDFKHSSEAFDVFMAEWQPPEWTCDRCALRHTCEFTYDMYNTNGDCLGEK